MEPPTKEEIELLNELRKNIQDLELSEDDLADKNLVRFLRARNGNIDAAEQMIRNNQDWIAAEDMKSLLLDYEPPKTWDDDFHYAVIGFDKDRCPLGIAPFGKWDIQKEMALGNKEEFVKYVYHHMEKLMALLKHLSKGEDHMKQVVGIVDLEGLTFRQVTSLDVVEAAVRCLKTFEANYPETVKAAVVVNAPWAFQLIWKIVKPFLSERTHAKLEFVGSDKEKWKEAIFRLADPDQVPESYGGTAPDSKEFFVARDGSMTCFQTRSEKKGLDIIADEIKECNSNSNSVIELK